MSLITKKSGKKAVDGKLRRAAIQFSIFSIPALTLLFKTQKAGANDINVNVVEKEKHPEEKKMNKDGVKKTGRALSVIDLKSTIPDFPGQNISLDSWHDQNLTDSHYPVGGGVLYSVFDDELEDDGGTVFRVNSEWCWVRNVSEIIDAQWFGVTGDGIDRSESISSAIDYITKNGGTLSFPNGKINFGKLRKRIEYYEGIKEFTIQGQGYSTIFTFDNIDPPERPSEKNWVSEAPLILIKGKGTEQYIDSPIIENLTIDYSSQRNGGGTNLETLEECHPTPHSIGAIAIYAVYCLNPVFRNIKFNNIYGSGIYCRKSFNPVSSNLYFYNVSANQIIDRVGKMDKDNSGGAIFYWSCYGGKIEGCIAWNKRKYTSLIESPDNGQQIQNTLCGYIGFWSEFSLNRTDRDDNSPPMMDWLNNKESRNDRVSRGTEIYNCTVYGYVIGIKGESAVDISIVNNKVLNCYLPILCSGVRGIVQRNFTDMLACEDVLCPQGGLEEKRSHLGGVTFAPKSVYNQNLEITSNYVRTKNYPAFTTSRINLKFLYNYININGRAPIFKSVSKGDFHGLEITGNTFIIESGSVPAQSNLYSNNTVTISKNSFESKSTKPVIINFSSVDNSESSVLFYENYIDGPVELIFKSSASIKNNNIIMPAAYNGDIIKLKGNESELTNNYFLFNSQQKAQAILIGCENVRIESNNIKININGDVTSNGIFHFESHSRAPLLIGNKIINNKVNLSLIVADVLIMPTIENNISDGDAALLWIREKLKGPVTFKLNSFQGGFINNENAGLDANLISNLWEDYSPCAGERIFYMLPIPGGKEGIVMTTNGWREFGCIATQLI